eukprot:TRINITY_DN3032_c0_g1_i1.p1 TRINITY_DN3032_c0_g1~~TRINITY_DN3032_c0_g1_i1.p1  ORF type:complete len:771 (+),score=227.04 TRINITY_DN3032_c0_g1_i1:77-2389(+)
MAAVALLAALGAAGAAAPRSFVVANDSFVKDGNETVVLRSGSLHYFRLPSAYWADRLRRLQAMGLNAVQTYVPWNWHEERSGEYDFSSEGRNLSGFVRTAQALGMLVLLRVGPYTCGEWEFGGYPAWILTRNVTVRTYEPNYIALVDKWFKRLLAQEVRPLLYANGGPIVMVQVENEYGSYGDVSTNPADRRYMEHLIALANTHLGEGQVVLYTTDGGSEGYMTRGSIPGSSVLTLGDGVWACDAQAKFNPPGLNPCMNTENYPGWFATWGGKQGNTSTSDYGVGAAVKAGRSFNFYMAYGGTNYGWFSGAGGAGGRSYQPITTSYDYDAPVSENGDHGFGSDGRDKFAAVRAALLPFAPPGGLPAEPPPVPRKAYGAVRLTGAAPLLSAESLAVLSDGPHAVGPTPVPMEALGQYYGLIYYTAAAAAAGESFEIVDYPSDRAHVFVNDTLRGIIYRPSAAPLSLAAAPVGPGDRLGVLVENMGRLTGGHGWRDPKGISTDIEIDGKPAAAAWDARTLPLEYAQLQRLSFAPVANCSAQQGPTFYRGELQIDGPPADAYLKPEGWAKGIMWVNGVNLGRYWNDQGPQLAFYAPAPLLRSGPNAVVLLELDAAPGHCTVRFTDAPDFSGKPKQYCRGPPAEGGVLHARECNDSWGAQQVWERRAVSGGWQLALGELCLGAGPASDPTSGSPRAQLHACSGGSAAVVNITAAGAVVDSTGRCLDITGGASGEPTEWYGCNGGSNQHWALQGGPSGAVRIVSAMDSSCLSACA